MSALNNTRVIKAGIGYTIGNILIKGMAFLTIPIFVRLMSTESYGIYSTYISYESIISIIFTIGLEASIRNAKGDYPDEIYPYTAAIIGCMASSFVVVLLLTNLLYFCGVNVLGYDLWMINILLVHSFGMAIITTFNTLISNYYQYKVYLVISGFNAIGNVLLSILLIKTIFIDNTHAGRIIGTALPIICLAAVIAVWVISLGRTLYNRDYWKYAMAIGLPLLLHKLSLVVLSQFGRIMVANMVGNAEAGIYGLIFSVGTVLTVLWNSVDTAWTPWVFDQMEAGNDTSLRLAAQKYVAIMTLGIPAMIAVAPEIIKIIATKDYFVGIPMIAPMFISVYYVVMYSFYVQLEKVVKETRYVALATVSAAILNIVLNYWVILWFGYQAVAYTTAFSYLCMFIFHRFVILRILKLRIYDERYMIGGIAFVTVVGLGMNLLGEQAIIRWIIGCLLGIVALIIMKETFVGTKRLQIRQS